MKTFKTLNLFLKGGFAALLMLIGSLLSSGKAKGLVIAFMFISLSLSAQTTNSSDRWLWNKFVENLEDNGLRGCVCLDENPAVAERFFNKFTTNMGIAIEYKSFIVRVQKSIVEYRANALNQIHSGKASFTGKDTEFMPGLSNVDGWAGSRTTSYKFPADSIPVYQDGKIVTLKPNNTYHD